ncbi:lutropin-choriogonadotropic hormone receptor isoform X1 [Drosophila ananassae]|uniref:lutropin-choriogonadotropic hormone receptor isoform X1 n=1 Tax=Drosophila ananassae TaxID=7217 RepID=UPI0013A5DFFB|nr:lutropin-choriogonadotropic hormone receptor isoform X1 [Drosophila ananassae]XP_032305596.1 lutropin-choriogonadotropic hormone receptor isoform X1 [Drosophila ananassae]XP_032305597.1 lutropin-choriogonadotropic hormone receptor isoform X1 [Drosophila ananassae]XP_032305599.1 lutropin-choriogonadotropic hormone receptor isoform X1 [Drosophila ananassae]
MKCVLPKFVYRLLLHHLLLTRICWPHGVYATSAVCHDSHNGFNVSPDGNSDLSPDRNPTTMSSGQAPPPTLTLPPWKCCCWNATNQSEEVECRCEGEALTRVPQTLTMAMQRLTIASAGLPRLRATGLKVYAQTLLDVAFTDCLQLELIQDGAFANLKLLRTIYIANAPKLSFLSKDVFSGISDTVEIIRIINSGLTSVPDLTHLPPYNILQMIDLDNNQITRIDSKSIKVKTAQLILANNDISYVDDSAFFGSKIAKLSLKENRKLKELHTNAFHGIIDITELDLSSTSIVEMPSAGLQTIEALYILNTHTLKTIPSIYNFRNLQRAYLTHSFHCCAFQFPSRHDPLRHAQRMLEIEKWRTQCNGERNSRRERNIAKKIESQQDDLGTLGGSEALSADVLSTPFSSVDYMADAAMNLGYFHEEITINPDDEQFAEFCGNFTFRKPSVECYPMPDALNPCEDVMGYQWLRISVWVVVALAVVGNVAVLTVNLSIRPEITPVARFLMCHLAFADLCLGLYLFLVASIDAHSMGEYFNYAYDWQYGLGCKVAGFLTVFASHLSVFTLTLITIERWVAITQAMYLNKRIRLRSASIIMLGGWIYSMVMSSLPLFGISNYSSTSICLPMEVRDTFDTVYLIGILGCNGVAFFIIAVCYAKIYFSLGRETRHARQNNPGELSVAKKMSLLVFTNFACWSPIAFFGLTALAGYPLINVTNSKILLVFFYPLNSCADPYLYAILTAQYRQDLYTLLSKLGLCRTNAVNSKDNSSGMGTTRFTIHRHSSLTCRIPPALEVETQKMLTYSEEYV